MTAFSRRVLELIPEAVCISCDEVRQNAQFTKYQSPSHKKQAFVRYGVWGSFILGVLIALLVDAFVGLAVSFFLISVILYFVKYRETRLQLLSVEQYQSLLPEKMVSKLEQLSAEFPGLHAEVVGEKVSKNASPNYVAFVILGHGLEEIAVYQHDKLVAYS